MWDAAAKILGCFHELIAADKIHPDPTEGLHPLTCIAKVN